MNRYTFNVKVDLENAAFFAEDGEHMWWVETARMLRTVADLLESPGGAESGPIVDINGNTSGFYGVNRAKSECGE